MNALSALFSFLTWRHLTRRPPHIPYNSPHDGPMCEEFTSCTPEGPPPEPEENPCSIWITDEAMEERHAQRAIAELEKRFNS